VPPPDRPTAGDQGIATAPVGQLSLEALLTGKVAFRHGCLFVDPGPDTQPIVPIFPQGMASWTDDGQLLFDGTRYAIGAVIALPGGYMASDRVDVNAGSIPAGCTADQYFIVSASG